MFLSFFTSASARSAEIQILLYIFGLTCVVLFLYGSVQSAWRQVSGWQTVLINSLLSLTINKDHDLQEECMSGVLLYPSVVIGVYPRLQPWRWIISPSASWFYSHEWDRNSDYAILHGFSAISFLSKIVGIFLWSTSYLPPVKMPVKMPSLWTHKK